MIARQTDIQHSMFGPAATEEQAREAERERFVKTHARRDGPPTSKKVAEQIALKADTQCGIVLRILRKSPITSARFHVEAAAAGVYNPRARVSDLRGWGAEIEVDKDHVYRLMKDIKMEGEA